MGSILFVTLEGDIEESDGIETAVAASKPYPRTNDLINADLRSRYDFLSKYSWRSFISSP
jgi:hypothetical protein